MKPPPHMQAAAEARYPCPKLRDKPIENEIAQQFTDRLRAAFIEGAMSAIPSTVTRFEVIDTHRSYTKHHVKSVQIDIQDEGRTCKVFINW